MKKKKCKCAICRKEHTNIEILMPNGVAVCLDCAKDVYGVVYALKVLAECEPLKN